MNIQINLDGTESGRELDALAALIASLRGETAIGMPHELADRARHAAPSHATPDEQSREDDERAAGRPTGSPSIGEAFPAGDSSSRENPEGAPDRDSEGLPWDERIHSGNKATNADGTWRKRRGVDEVMFGKVVAELQERVAGENAPVAAASPVAVAPPITPAATDVPPPPPPAAIAPSPPPAAESPNAPATVSQAPPPPPPVVTAPASAPSGGDPMGEYRALMTRVSSTGRPYAEWDEQARMLGLSKFTDLVRNLDRVAEFAAHVEAMGLLPTA